MPSSPIIEIVPMGNLANRTIQYLVALEIQRWVPGSVLSNVALPELQIVVQRTDYDVQSETSLTLYDYEFIKPYHRLS